MTARSFLVVAALLGFLLASPAQAQDSPSGPTLAPFESEAELAQFLDDYFARRDQLRGRAAGVPVPSQQGPQVAIEMDMAPAAEDESITNVQHEGVDEGGIVKVHGDHLVILRRGRLFTVRLDDESLTPVSAVDAYAPDIEPRGAWYDEMLIADDVVIVVGYSYRRRGTEIGLFEIDARGNLQHGSTYHLRSNDYYSSRNYASRLVDGKLVFYTPLALWSYRPGRAQSLAEVLPAMRRWRGAGEDSGFEPIATATSIYRPARELESFGAIALHTVTTCDPAGAELSCSATAVLGPWGHVFYASTSSIYVWLAGISRRGESGGSMLYRMPLDGTSPTALGVSGSPIDQFSFLESADDHLNVLVRSRGGGQWMWRSEHAPGPLRMLRVPLASFGDGQEDAPHHAYLTLPSPEGSNVRNRFVGEHLLYGSGSGWRGRPQIASSDLFAVHWQSGRLSMTSLPHGVDRIEVMGTGAVVVGSGGNDLHFSSIRLGARPMVVDRYVFANASQGETRSHGFFYRPDDAGSGVLGLPVRNRSSSLRNRLTQGSAAITFVRNDGLRLSDLGNLVARPETAVNDHCTASCVDWYGNARPIFLRGRIFALMGYEMVEGRLVDGRIREVGRTSFAPGRQVVELAN